MNMLPLAAPEALVAHVVRQHPGVGREPGDADGHVVVDFEDLLPGAIENRLKHCGKKVIMIEVKSRKGKTAITWRYVEE